MRLQIDMTVVLQATQYQVGDPEAKKETTRDDAVLFRSAEFASAETFQASDHEENDGHGGERTKDSHAERQRAFLHFEFSILVIVIPGRDRPRQTDAEKNVHSVRAVDVANRAVGILIMLSRHFRGERIYGRR